MVLGFDDPARLGRSSHGLFEPRGGSGLHSGRPQECRSAPPPELIQWCLVAAKVRSFGGQPDHEAAAWMLLTADPKTVLPATRAQAPPA